MEGVGQETVRFYLGLACIYMHDVEVVLKDKQVFEADKQAFEASKQAFEASKHASHSLMNIMILEKERARREREEEKYASNLMHY